MLLNWAVNCGIRKESELEREKSGARSCSCFSVLGRRARRKPAVGVGMAAWDRHGGAGGEACMHMYLCMDGRKRVAGCCTSELCAEAKTQEWRPNP